MAFVFSDLEGCTRLLESIGPSSYGRLLTLYRETVEGMARSEGGEVVNREGDGIFLVFATASAALRVAARSQVELGDVT